MKKYKKSTKFAYEMDEDDIAYTLEHDKENKHVMLTVISKKSMTGIDYLAMLNSFVENSIEEADNIFTDDFSYIIEMQ